MGSISLAAIAIDKLLNGTEWRVVSFFFMLDQQKRSAEFGMQIFRLVSHYRQAAVFSWAIFCKRGNDHMAARAN